MCVYYYIFALYVLVYIHNICTAIRLSLWNILQETFLCRTIENFCKCDKLDAPWKTQWIQYMIRVMAFVYDQQEQFTFTFTLSSISWCPALLKSASNWDAGALNSCDTSTRMWTSSWGFANTKTVQCCPLQNNNMITIISTITSTIAATTTYLTDWQSKQLSAYWVLNWLTN